jgi:histidinol-phosphate aminotransferase
MRLDLTQIIRPNILSLRPYESARSIANGGRIFLDANEAPDDPMSVARFNRYPEPQPAALRQQLAAYYQVHASQIYMGRGSDEAIDLLVRMTCTPNKDAILSCPPTYGMYAVAAEMQGARNVEVTMLLESNRFAIDLDRVTSALTDPSIKIFFLCRPNNPTGEITTLREVATLAELCGPGRLLVVDEAYIEFSGEPSAISLLDQYPNIVVLRTFSKAWALAGVRFGVAISSLEIAEILERIRAPYPVPTPVRDLVAAHLITDRIQSLQKTMSSIRSERERLTTQISKLRSVKLIYPSATNFLLVKIPGHARSVFNHLMTSGIVVRNRSNQPLLGDCLRITVGSPQDNNELLNSWRDWERVTYA